MNNNLNVFKYRHIHKKYYFGKLISNFFKKIKWSWQRITKGYCDYDLHDLNNFYTNLIIKSLKEFIKITKSYPWEYMYKNNDEDLDIGIRKWQDKINKVIDAFIEYRMYYEQRTYCYFDYETSEEELIELRNKAFKLFEEVYENLYQ